MNQQWHQHLAMLVGTVNCSQALYWWQPVWNLSSHYPSLSLQLRPQLWYRSMPWAGIPSTSKTQSSTTQTDGTETSRTTTHLHHSLLALDLELAMVISPTYAHTSTLCTGLEWLVWPICVYFCMLCIVLCIGRRLAELEMTLLLAQVMGCMCKHKNYVIVVHSTTDDIHGLVPRNEIHDLILACDIYRVAMTFHATVDYPNYDATHPVIGQKIFSLRVSSSLWL